MSLVIHYLSCNGVFYLSHVGRGGGTLCNNTEPEGGLPHSHISNRENISQQYSHTLLVV